LLLELGSVETQVDGDAAIEHLQEAHALIEDPIRRAEAALLLGRQLFLLRGIATRMRRSATSCCSRCSPTRMREPASPPPRPSRSRAAHLPREGSTSQLSSRPARCSRWRTSTRCWCYEDALAEAHRRGSTFAFAAVKVFRAQTLVWRGDLGEAEDDARAALVAGEAWGASARFAGHAAASLADALMEEGKLDDAAAALARVGFGETLPESARLLYLSDSTARLRILRGDLAGGLAEMLDAGRRFEAVGSRNPAFIAWRSPAALALHQLGERDDARRLVNEELELARTWGAPCALGAALRAAGLVEGGQGGLALLEEAVHVLHDSPAKLEHAKARTELGAALRRANRRSGAREQLRHAVELATICGAAPFAARAERELLSTGARPRRIALSGADSLTPSERRVAEMAAAERTNREIAQALFVTPRTVEVHLTSIYRSSRSTRARNLRPRSLVNRLSRSFRPSRHPPPLAVRRTKQFGWDLGAPTTRTAVSCDHDGSMFTHPIVHLEHARRHRSFFGVVGALGGVENRAVRRHERSTDPKRRSQ
jgi:DNA-binding CsgD family transcriptional regulator